MFGFVLTLKYNTLSILPDSAFNLRGARTIGANVWLSSALTRVPYTLKVVWIYMRSCGLFIPPVAPPKYRVTSVE